METSRMRHVLALGGLAIAAAVAIFAATGTNPTTTHADGVPLAIGDVLAGTGTGQIKHFDNTGTLLDTLDKTTSNTEDTGMCFDGSLNLHATNFADNSMSVFDSGGNLVGPFGSGFNADPESCVVDAAGNVYVGQADGTADVLKFDSAGTLVDSFDVATTARGSDWIDLAADQCTLQYTSENSEVKRYNVCTDTQLPDFATGLARPCFANRILGDGGSLVACFSQIYRLDSTGAVIDTFDATGEDSWFALNLDPDGTSFWSANIFTGEIYRFDIATGAVLIQFNGTPTTTLAGLAIVGEPTQGGGGCAEGVISPAEVEGILFPGESLEIEKCIEVPEFPPVLDVYFLADTTGSMTPALAAVQADAATILGTIDGGSADAQFGAGDYKDFPFDAYAFNPAAAIGTDDGLGGGADASDAIAAWLAGGGGDGPEAQLFALHKIATDPAIGFRSGASKIVVIFGDAPGHDPVCAAISGESSDITEATVTADLVAAGIKVVAISTLTGYPAGLDDDPTAGALDYGVCGAPGGLAGQATRIAAATGGVHLTGVSAGDISDAILAGIGAVDVEVTMESTCTWPITTTFEPASQTVESGGTATFTETITVASDAPGGTYVCRDVARIDGELLIDPATGFVAYELKTIKVPEGFLTGGGEIITTRKKEGLKIGQSGNVGFLADFTLVGNWNVLLHNVSGTALDKGHFHSKEITFLQFHKDGGAGPNPPPANANVGAFAATGEFNGIPGYSVQVCLADRGEPGKNDSIRIRLFDPANVLIYDSATDFASEDNTLTGFCTNRHKVDNGNYQIHSGLKQ